MKPVRKAVLPAAGFGTRFLPFTRAVPKEMIPLVDKPVIQYVVEEAAAAGIEENDCNPVDLLLEAPEFDFFDIQPPYLGPVSYTHLTLPTT